MTECREHTGLETSSGDLRQSGFVTTQWSIVLAAGATQTATARKALSVLCQRYWYPLYAYVRRRGWNPQDAEDLTQDFFARLLQKESLAHVTREGGRFRSFLLKSLDRFLTDEWRRSRTQKRGSGKIIPFDSTTAETRFLIEPAEAQTPETLYDRAWALSLLSSTYDRLRDEYMQNGKEALFGELRFCLTGERGTIPYRELADRLKITEGTVKTLVHRFRKRYRQLLREEVAQTVDRPEEIEQELQSLFRALS